MPGPESPIPLSAVGLRLTDEVGQAVLDWVATGDLSASAALDQHVAALRAGLAGCQPDDVRAARLAGQAAGRAVQSEHAQSQAPPHHARRTGGANQPDRAEPATNSPAVVAPGCPAVPFAASAWYADEAPPLRLLLHYACGFVEAAVRADWWPGENDTPRGPDFEALRLAAVCRLIRQIEAAAALPPDLR